MKAKVTLTFKIQSICIEKCVYKVINILTLKYTQNKHTRIVYT